MQPATSETVLGDFDDAEITAHGTTSTFFRRDDRFWVRTDGPDGALHEYAIDHVFGVTPLQQYLVAFPGGRYQVLPLCWDTRSETDGGQRWFHLYEAEEAAGAIDHADPLHWTGIYQNWNYVCAECHSTDLRRNYDLAADRYDTTWAEIDVSCEACHGPGSRHVAWARAAADGADTGAYADLGLTVRLKDDDGGSWIMDPATGTAERSPARASHAQVEACARCHARRTPIGEYEHGRPLLDTHRLSLLEERLYHADGQIRDEVYVYGSFLQSRMHRAGVTCSDCHDPHTGRVIAPGNVLCSQCHQPSRFDTPEHHFHDPDGAGASCVECHMPERTYMVVDPRRDHSIRVPRPDLSVALGTPNACNGCHDDRTAAWAAEAVVAWYGADRRREPHFGTALHAGRRGGPGADQALADLADDPEQPGIARATALTLLARSPSPRTASAVRRGLRDADPLVRAAAAGAMAMVPPEERADALVPLLDDPVKLVRLQAADVLADVPPASLAPDQREAVDRGVTEYVQAELASADRPEAHLNTGVMVARRGMLEAAESAYRAAIRLDPGRAEPYVNLADLYRMTGRDEDGERVLRDALDVVRDPAVVHHALGLVLVRRGETADAVVALGEAARLDPDDPRLSFVHAIALDSAGRRAEGLRVLEETLERHPYDRDTLVALATMNRDAGERGRALRYARRLLALMPEDDGVLQLVAELER
jgi:Flp pilus assembly protein TadD